MKVIPGLIILSFLLMPCLHSEEKRQSHGHHHHASNSQDLKLNNGQKWPVDQALKTNMAKIHAKVKSKVAAIHANQLSNQQYASLAKSFEKEIQAIFANCKLSPEADKALHIVLANMLRGIEGMKGKSQKVDPRAGIIKVVEALDQYGEFFNHPNWERFH